MIDLYLILIYLGGVVGTTWYFHDEAEPRLKLWQSFLAGGCWLILAGIVLGILVCQQGDRKP